MKRIFFVLSMMLMTFSFKHNVRAETLITSVQLNTKINALPSNQSCSYQGPVQISTSGYKITKVELYYNSGDADVSHTFEMYATTASGMQFGSAQAHPTVRNTGDKLSFTCSATATNSVNIYYKGATTAGSASAQGTWQSIYVYGEPAIPYAPNPIPVSPSGQVNVPVHSYSAGENEYATKYRYSSYYDFSQCPSFTVTLGMYRNGGNASALYCDQYVGLQAADGSMVVPYTRVHYCANSRHNEYEGNDTLSISPSSGSLTVTVPTSNAKVKNARIAIKMNSSVRANWSWQGTSGFDYRLTCNSITQGHSHSYTLITAIS